MDSLITLVCYYLFGTVIVVGICIVIQLSRKSGNQNRQAEQDGTVERDAP